MNADFLSRYLPVDNKAIDLGLYITGYGYEENRSKNDYPSKKHPQKYYFDWRDGRILPEFQLVFITDAKNGGYFETKETKQKIHDNSFFLLAPSIWHRYRPDFTTGWKHFWISFNGTLAHKIFDSDSIIKPNKVYTPDDFANILRKIEKFIALSEDKRLQTQNIAAKFLLGFFGSLELSIINKESDNIAQQMKPETNLADKVREIIWNWSHANITADDIAEKLGLSRRTLFRKLKEYENFSLGREVDLCKFTRAKDLLISTDLPIKTVAYLSGYRDLGTMRLTFLRECFFTPKGFRNKFRE